MEQIILLPIVENIGLSVKDGITKITMETHMSPGDVARLINFVRQGERVSASITSPQARMDLKIEEVNVRTGEVIR